MQDFFQGAEGYGHRRERVVYGQAWERKFVFSLVFFLTRPLDGVQNRCVMASGCVPSPSLGERRFLPHPKVFVMCFSIWLLQSTPSIPCSLLGFSLSPGCCLALLINSSDEWARQETNTFVTKPHRGFQRVMTLSQAVCLVNALSFACLYSWECYLAAQVCRRCQERCQCHEKTLMQGRLPAVLYDGWWMRP